jgi:hypothetical protein
MKTSENFLVRWWHQRLRRMDIEFLWAQLLRESRSRENAKSAFRMHMNLDPLYAGMDDVEKDRFVEKLP